MAGIVPEHCDIEGHAQNRRPFGKKLRRFNELNEAGQGWGVAGVTLKVTAFDAGGAVRCRLGRAGSTDSSSPL